MPDIASTQQARVSAYQHLLAWELAQSRRLGLTRFQRYIRNWEYVSGENLPPDNVEMPLGINLIQSVHEKHTTALFGQWEGDIVRWRCQPYTRQRGRLMPDGERQICEDIEDYLFGVQRANQANAVFFDTGMNGSIFGDGIIKVYWDVYEERVKWESVLPEFFHCRWHPSDMNLVTEAIVSYNVDRLDAYAQWGTYGNPEWAKGQLAPNYYAGMCVQWEHWTETSMEIWIDDVLVEQKPNPYMRPGPNGTTTPGIIPFVHIPNLRMGSEFFGFADGEPVFLLQDELNRIMADMSDVVNNHAHPITLLRNYIGSINDLTVGPDQVWDMGRDGEASYLSHDGPSPEVLEFTKLLKEFFQDTAHLPDAAWGRSRQSQASGVALAMAMLPVTDRVGWKRLIWDIRLRQLARKSIYIQETMAPGSLPFSYRDAVRRDIVPVWAAMLPKDRLATVNENVALVSNHIRDIQTALEDLGEEDPGAVKDAVVAEIKELAPYGVFGKPAAGGGSNALPGSGQKPGAPAKDD